MDKKPMYFQLEPGAFLSDMDFQVMTAEQRGVYCTLIFYLYLNDGKLKHDMPLLSKICNVNSEFDFKDVLGKFQIHRGFIYHKRVTSEFTRSSDRMKIEQEWKSKSSQGGIRSARIKKAREIGTHTALEWQYLVCEAGNICPRCEKFTDQFTKDHVQPIYQNGSDAITNIQPLCSGCNSAKGSDSTDFFQVQREQALRNLYNSGMVPRVVEPPLVTIREGKKRKEKVSKEKNNNPSISPQKSLFETIRKEYPGTKRGLDEEWDYLDIVCRKHKLNREQTVPKIVAGVNRLLEWRKNAAAANVFVPPPKNFKTWLFNRCWTDEFPALPHKKTQADKKKEYEEYEKQVKQYER